MKFGLFDIKKQVTLRDMDTGVAINLEKYITKNFLKDTYKFSSLYNNRNMKQLYKY